MALKGATLTKMPIIEVPVTVEDGPNIVCVYHIGNTVIKIASDHFYTEQKDIDACLERIKRKVWDIAFASEERARKSVIASNKEREKVGNDNNQFDIDLRGSRKVAIDLQ